MLHDATCTKMNAGGIQLAAAVQDVIAHSWTIAEPVAFYGQKARISYVKFSV